jgi:sterol desaturase/sphingolipid hydroxylase (fatty acid hydroxylase superfamily)
MEVNHLETWLPVVAILLVVASFFLHRWKKSDKGMSVKESLANISIFIVWKYLFFAAGVALQLTIFSWISKFSFFQFENPTLSLVLVTLLADFAYYWKHRYEHLIPVLWCQHAVHHSSREFNFSTSLRLPWVGSYINWMFFIPVLLVGFSPIQVMIGHKIILAYQYIIHTEYIKKLGFLELILNTPSNHRAHHGRNKEYIDKNFGGILIIWDHVFKTYEPEVAVVEYGTTKEMKSKNPVIINAQPWIDLYKSTMKKETLIEKLKYPFFPS